MESVKYEQNESPFIDLSGSEAGKRMKEMAEQAKTCFFCTETSMPGQTGVRPMSVLKADDDGTLWFLSAKDSQKNREIKINDDVKLFFQGSAHSDFLHVTGKAAISTDPAKIHELWIPLAKAWFTEGKEDPRISVIKFTPNDGMYWDNKHGDLVAGVKMLMGAALGKTIDDGVAGKLEFN